MKSKTKRLLIGIAVVIIVAVALIMGLYFGLKKTDGESPDNQNTDVEKPVISFNTADTLEAGESLEVKYTATDNVGVVSETVTVEFENQDVTAIVYNMQTKLFMPTAAGGYTIIVEVRDAAGNSETAMHTVTVTAPMEVDTQKPAISFNTADTLEAGSSLEVQYTATDNVGVVSETVTVEFENQDVTAIVYNMQTKLFTPTAAGEYTITVVASDAAGNSETASHTVTVTLQAGSAYELPNNPNFGNGVAVHDPSIYYDETTQKYYVFGSHFAVASSSDLIHWKQEAQDDHPEFLYGTTNFRSKLTATSGKVGGSENTWAPDVVKIGDTYYMYYSLTAGFGKNRSAIGRVSSKNVLGPYSNDELIVWGEGDYNKAEPNCIDPELFYDKEGRLWMVYGSFYAGIYIKELSPATGLPLESGEHDFGKLLWKGADTGVEGPFIFYNAETDYYYLITSDGSLFTDYNMRVARSKNPDGPYTDITGANMATAYGGGNKLAGNYQFAEDGTGYAAMGHNSVIKTDGKYFVVYHTRYRQNSDSVTMNHNLHVNQLFFNEDGWPVLSPNRYAGETLARVAAIDAAGKYDIVLHTEGNSVSFASSSRYKLAEDGTVRNNQSIVKGNWSITGDYYITVTLGGVEYKGVIAPAWCTYGEKGILCFTATSSNGRSLWANAAVSDTELAAGGVKILQTVEGDASNTQIAAFDVSNGFAVSFYLQNATSDWNSATIGTSGQYQVHLPNLNAFDSDGTLKGAHVYPNGNLQNGHAYTTYLNTQCYVTISISDSGITYYKNGGVVLQYQSDNPIHFVEGDRWEAYPRSVKTFIDLLLADIQTDGFTFAGQITASDLILSEAVTAEQAAALYSDYSN